MYYIIYCSVNGQDGFQFIALYYIKFRLKMPKHFSHFTDTSKFTVKMSYGKDAQEQMRVLKACRELDDVPSAAV